MNVQLGQLLMRHLVLLIGLAICAAPACAGLIIAGTDQAHIDMAADPMFQNVGWVTGYTGTVGNIAGTGVLFGQQWFLTAGHVTTGYDSLKISFTSSALDPTPNYVDVDTVYSLYNDAPLFGDDIALLHLSQPVLDVTPAVLSTEGLQVGIDTVWAGYGYVSEYPGPDAPYDGIKRAGAQIIDRFGNGTNFGTQYFKANFGPVLGGSYSLLEMGARPRDSGSPVYILENGQWVVGGVVTTVDIASSTFGVRTDHYNDWISSVTSVPEPSSCLLFSSASLLSALRKRRLSDR